MAFTGTPYARSGYAPVLGSDGSYGDISPRQAVQVSMNMLERAIPHMLIEMFGRSEPLKSNTGKSILLRRYKSLPAVTAALEEGVTPAVRKLTAQDYNLPLTPLGDVVEFSDEVEDLGEANTITQGETVCGECAAESVELLRLGMLAGGTSRFLSNGSARNAVNTPPTKDLFTNVERYLLGKNAKTISRYITPGPGFGSASVAPAFIAFCHTDLKAPLQALSGWTDVKDYAQPSPWPMEIGSICNIRFLTSTLFGPWKDAGGAKGTMLSTGGTSADVYPIYIFGADAYAISAFRGAHAITPSVIAAGKKTKSDPLGQRGYIGWKTRAGACILNDDHFVRVECAAPAL